MDKNLVRKTINGALNAYQMGRKHIPRGDSLYTYQSNFDVKSEMEFLKAKIENAHTIILDEETFNNTELGTYEVEDGKFLVDGKEVKIMERVRSPFQNAIVIRNGTYLNSFKRLVSGQEVIEGEPEIGKGYNLYMYYFSTPKHVYFLTVTANPVRPAALYPNKVFTKEQNEKHVDLYNTVFTKIEIGTSINAAKSFSLYREKYVNLRKTLEAIVDSKIRYIVEEVPFRYKVKMEGTKVVFKGKRKNLTVYTVQGYKKYLNSFKDPSGDLISRHFVMGHWRNMEGKTGKDIEGKYCVPNKTWVTEHIRGDFGDPVNTDRTIK